jgi:hypothetical protein
MRDLGHPSSCKEGFIVDDRVPKIEVLLLNRDVFLDACWGGKSR